MNLFTLRVSPGSLSPARMQERQNEAKVFIHDVASRRKKILPALHYILVIKRGHENFPIYYLDDFIF
jgi:hypothetical protein